MLRTLFSPYYSSATFSAFVPLAVVYSFIAQLLIKPDIKALPPPEKESSKVVIVTGSNTGIGYETAKCLANRYGYTVILACRSPDKAQEAAKAIGENAVFVHPLDLSSFQSVVDFVDAIQARYKAIHILINNAGRNTSGVSKDGLDLQFQTNFVGHFLLTNQLIDRKILTEDARIINLSSVMHHFCWPCTTIDTVGFWKYIADASGAGPKLFGMPILSKNTYMLSKLAAILFTQELNNRYPKISSIAANPGAVNSDIWRTFPGALRSIIAMVFLTTEQGSHTSVVAATTSARHETYLQPYWLPKFMSMAFPVMELMGPFVGSRYTTPRLPPNPDAAGAALWAASQELTQEWTNKMS